MKEISGGKDGISAMQCNLLKAQIKNIGGKKNKSQHRATV